MALDKKTLSFALLKGIDEKSSDSARPPDALTVAENADFGKRGELKKRGGFVHDDNMTRTKFGGGDISKGVAISQYGDETLLLDGKKMYSWIKQQAGGQGLLDRGTYVPCTVEHEFKHRNRDRRQGNAQIAEKNGVRVYVWEEYEFQGSKYKTFVDIEHIASGSKLIATTEISSVTISVGAATSLYVISQPQCAVIGNYVFIVYQEGGNMRYRYVNCANITAAAAISAEQNLYNHLGAQVQIDTSYPVFQIDKFSGQTHSDAIVFLYYNGSGNLYCQYLTASGTTLSMPSTNIQVSTDAFFQPFGRTTGGLATGLMLKCLNDNDGNDADDYQIIVGYTVHDSSSGTYRVKLVQIKDNLGAKVEHADQNVLADGSSTGSIYLLNGTAGVKENEDSSIHVFVGVWGGNDLGTQGLIVPEHFIRRYTLTRGSTTIATTTNVVAFNASITSDFFNNNSELYCAISHVNDNGLYVDFDATSPSGASRGENNNTVVVNVDGELIGALRTGSVATCLTSEYINNNPLNFNTAQENRRLLHGIQRVTSRDSGKVFVFGASRWGGYAFYDPGTYGPGDYPDNVFGVSLFTVDFDPDRTLASVDIEGSWLGSGGFIHSYDGQEIVENNFAVFPAIKSLTCSTRSSTSSGFSDGKVIKYCTIYSWTDAKGNEHVSLPSSMIEVTIPSGRVSGHGAIAGGSGYSTASNVSVSGGSGSGCKVNITAPSGAVTDVTIADPGTGYTNGDSLSISGGTSGTFVAVVTGKSTNSLEIYVPSVTRKTGVVAKLYRTDDTGGTFFLVADIPVRPTTSPTSSFVTYVDLPRDETAITSRPQLYTTTFPGTGFAGCSTDLVRHQNKIISASTDDEAYVSTVILEGTAPGFPIGFFNKIALPGDPGKITAVEGNLDHLLVFTDTDGYYVSGPGPDILGQGKFTEPRLFASGQGALPGAAHTDSPLGVFYQTERGLHLIGRDLSISYIGAAVEDTVGSKTAVSMTRRDADNAVRIMLQSASPGSSGNDIYCVYNYYYKQWATYNIAYQSSAHQVGEVYDKTSFQRLTADGRIFTQSTTVYQDRNSAGSALVDYGMTVTTGFISPTGLLKKDRIYRVMLLGEYLAAHTLRVDVYNDYDDATSNQTETKTISSAPAGAYLYRAHLSKQKSRAVKLSVLIGGATQAMTLAGFALEVGMRPDKTSFKTIEDRTL